MEGNILVARCVAKDHKAWSVFVKEYTPLVRRVVRHKMRCMRPGRGGEESFDIAQEVFTSIWEDNKLSGLRDAKCLRSWLVMLAVNHTRNYFKRREVKKMEKEVSLEKDIPGCDGPITLGSMLRCDKYNGEAIMRRAELLDAVNGVIKDMSARQQLAIKLCLFHGVRHRDIAKIMNLPVNTVSTLIKRAKGRLRDGARAFLGLPDRA